MDKLKIISYVKNQNESQIYLIITSSFHNVKTNYYFPNYPSSNDITPWLIVSQRSPQYPVQITLKDIFFPFQKVLKDRFVITHTHRHTHIIVLLKSRKRWKLFPNSKDTLANFTFLAQNITWKSLPILLSTTKSSPFQSVLLEALPAFNILK